MLMNILFVWAVLIWALLVFHPSQALLQFSPSELLQVCSNAAVPMMLWFVSILTLFISVADTSTLGPGTLQLWLR